MFPLMLLTTISAAAGNSQTAGDFAELPTYHIATPEELQRDFVNMKFEPLDDPQLKMSFLVGKDWQPQPIGVKLQQLKEDRLAPVELVLVLSPDGKARLSVAYLRVDPKTDLEQWVGLYLKGNKLSPSLRQVGTFSGRKVVDVLISAPGKQKVRMTFSRHADRILILAGSCPEDLYPTYARHFGLAAVGFKLGD